MSLQVKFAFRKGVVRRPSRPVPRTQTLPLGDLPLAPVCRTYRCHRCPFHTNQAKLFLFHQRDEHGDQMTIYPCTKCEYASKYKNKLYRHNKLVHTNRCLTKVSLGTKQTDGPMPGSSADPVVNGVDSPNYINGDDGWHDIDGDDSRNDNDDIDGDAARNENGNVDGDCANDDIDGDDAKNDNDVLGETEVEFDFDSEMNFETVEDLDDDNGDVSIAVGGAEMDDMVVDDETIEMMDEEDESIVTGRGVDRNIVTDRKVDQPQPDPTENAYDYIVGSSSAHSPHLFQCRLCTYVNAHKWKIANHIRNTHMKKTLFKCPYCEFVCSRKIEWCIHKTRHTNKTVYSCTECFYRTTMKRNFDRHLSRHRIRGPIKCGMCSYSSTGEAAIQRHMAEYHTSPEKSDGATPAVMKPMMRHAATTGSRRLTKIMRMSSHRDFASSQSHRIMCSICGQTLHSESKLREHMASHSDIVSCECPICPMRYMNTTDLHAHLKNKHNLEPDDIACLNINNDGSNVVNTNNGDDGSNGLTNNNGDDGSNEQNEPLNLSVKEPWESTDANSWTDEFCDETSELIQQDEPLDLSVVAHNRFILLQPENLRCTHCSYIAKWPSDLHRHMMVHSIEKRFKCRYCAKKYKYRFDLNMHLRKTHKIPAGRNRKTGSAAMHHADSMAYFASSGARKAREDDGALDKAVDYMSNRHAVSPGLKCKHCPYVGKYKAEVERHMRLHSGNKQWCCIHCSYKTYWKGDMKRHLQKHHPAEVKAIGDVFELLSKTFVKYDDPPLTPDTQPDGATTASSTAHVASDYIDGDVSMVAVKTEPIDEFSGATDRMLEQLEASADMTGFVQEAGHELEEESTECVDVLSKKFCKCPLCAFVCEAPSKLKCHMEIHDNLKRFMCPTCGKRSNWLWDVRKHIRKEHPSSSMEVTVLPETQAMATLDEYLATQGVASSRNSPAKLDSTAADELASNASFEMPPMSLPKVQKQATYGVRCRPYKCSMCGRRSNWKWDLNKHIKTVHPGATVIVLSEEEARMTLHEVMPYTKPSKTNAPSKVFVANDVAPRSSQASVLKQLTAMHCRPFKCSRCGQRSNWKWDIKKHIRMNHANAAHVIILSEQEAMSTIGEVHNKSRNTNYRRTTPQPSGQLKRFRCTLCEYHANYRSDILRHIRRVHKCTDKQIVLQNVQEVLVPVAPPRKPSLLETYITTKTEPGVARSSPLADAVSSSESEAALAQKLWRCSKCNFRDRNKGVVVHHYRTHSYGTAFACRLCGDTSDYRNSIYRHIRNKHQREDYTEIIIETALHPEKVDSVPTKETPARPNNDAPSLPQSSKLYRCHECGCTSGYKSVIVQHCKTEHHTSGAETTIQEIYTSASSSPLKFLTTPSPAKAALTVAAVNTHSPVVSCEESDSKRLHCPQCPFKTNKTGLLRLHSCYHKPQTGNNFKCKYCPYYVCAMRLLHQHMRLHLAEQGIIKEAEDAAVTSPLILPLAQHAAPARSPTKSLRTKYHCDKCPYSSTNKNDSLYHKQFHRPRASAPYKCDHCPYWVTYRRLLSQHVKVHFRHQMEPPRDDASGPSSIEASPCKSEISLSDYLTEDVVKVAHIKQRIIASKITRVPITPEKLLPSPQPPPPNSLPGYIVNRRGHLMLSGSYRKLHRCRFCPYTNVRGVNLRLHEKMHGFRGDSSVTGKELLKCPYCDYHVANKGLLTHHVKVHSHQYRPGIDEIDDTERRESDDDDDTASTATSSRTDVRSPQLNVKDLPKNVAYYVKYDDNTGEHILEKVMTKKWSCEKCGYVSSKKAQFERHVLLHASKQKYLCEYCDYSVPAYEQLVEHRKLHLMPNPNLLSVQSILNLQQLPEVPADVAAAANFTGSAGGSENNSTSSDDLQLYENSSRFEEPKKLYRCDRCPYTNVRRDFLLTHLKFHMIRGELTCPYCDYSVDRANLLTQHIKVHFSQQDGDDKLPEKQSPSHPAESERTTTASDTQQNSTSAVADIVESNTKESNCGLREVKMETDLECEDKVVDVTVDKVMDVTVEKVMDVTVGKVTDVTVDKVTDVTVDKVKVMDVTVGKVMDATVDNVMDVTVDNVTDVTVDKVMDVTVDKVTDVTVDKVVDVTVDKVVDVTVDKVVYVTVDKVADVTVDKVVNVTVGKVTDVTVGKVTDVTVDKVVNVTVGKVTDVTVGKDADDKPVEPTMWVCQYCERVFDDSPKLMRHEMQHLMGNQFWPVQTRSNRLVA